MVLFNCHASRIGRVNDYVAEGRFPINVDTVSTYIVVHCGSRRVVSHQCHEYDKVSRHGVTRIKATNVCKTNKPSVTHRTTCPPAAALEASLSCPTPS